jgi:aminoglycoside phosphotransferase (APT) family kinase protein
VETAAHRVPDDQLGPRLAAGRDAIVYALGDDRVVRRASDPERSYRLEAEVMEHVRALGYPVPAVHRLAPGEMVLDRVEGPTMLDDLASHPWRLRSHARLLADLQRRLHELPAPEGLRPFPLEGDRVLHLDFHPGNVMLSPDGPVVIDWTNVARGAPGAETALTWIVLAVFEADEQGLMKVVVPLFRRRFLRAYLAATDREAGAAALRAVAAYREEDRNIRPTERAALRRLVAECATA